MASPPVLRQIRRNHALEHATIHLLSGRVRGARLSGLSDAGGFLLFGDVPTATVERAAQDALARLQRGERQLAIHPNCGTNLVTTGYMTSIAGLFTTRGMHNRRDVVERIPVMMLSMIAAVLVSQPVGYWLQRHVTTDGDPADTAIQSVERRGKLGNMVIHRVNTTSS